MKNVRKSGFLSLMALLTALLGANGQEGPSGQASPPPRDGRTGAAPAFAELPEAGAPARAVENAPGAGRRVLVKFRAGTAEAARNALLGEVGDHIHQYSKHNQKHGRRGPAFFDQLASTRVKNGGKSEDALARLRSSPIVEYAELDAPVRIQTTPNDPLVPKLWGMGKIQAPAAWDLNTGHSEVVVAVIDTGVDYSHPDLAANMWVNGGEIPGNGLDDDGNGFIDDLYGCDFANNDSDPYDDHYHGTHCAGTIGAVGNNGVGVAGVTWGVRIMALKFLDAGGSGMDSAAVSAIQYAILNGAHVMSNSWGGTGYVQALQDAITAANNAGILFAAAAGNSNTNALFYPAAMEGVFCVAATDSNDQRASFSNYGSYIDVAAPGVGIFSTIPTRITTYGGYYSLSGTSMACPHVAGLAALLKSRNFTLSKDQLDATLRAFSDDLGIAGRDDIYGNGRINAFRALSGISASPPNVPVARITSPAAGQVVNSPFNIVGSASGPGFAGFTLDALLPGATSWAILLTSTTPVTNATLAQLVPQPNWPENGAGWIRLIVIDTAGKKRATFARFTYRTSQITGPLPYSEFSPGATVNVTGMSTGYGFQNYVLEYGIGESPAQWIVFAQSATPVSSGTLGAFLIPSGTDGYLSLRLSTRISGATKQIAIPIYVEGSCLTGWPVNASADTDAYLRPLTVAPISGQNRLFAPFDRGTNQYWLRRFDNFKYRVMIDQLQSAGSRVTGWPSAYNYYEISSVSSPAIDDLDRDGTPEIVLTGLQSQYAIVYVNGVPVSETLANCAWKLLVLRPDGSQIWTRPLNDVSALGNSHVPMTPALADLNGDGFLDILVGGSTSGSVLAFDRLGNVLPGFPIVVPNSSSWSPTDRWPATFAVADLDGDGKSEIVFWAGDYGGPHQLCIYRSNGTAFPMIQPVVQGAPSRMSSWWMQKPLSPVIADTDGDGKSEIISLYQKVDGEYIHTLLLGYRPDGTPLCGFSKDLGPISAGMALGDLDGDHVPEIVVSAIQPYSWSDFGDNRHGQLKCHAYRGDGTALSGWPVTIPGRFALRRDSEPLIVDLGGDGRAEIVLKETLTRISEPNWYLNTWNNEIGVEQVYALRIDGTVLSGYPRQLGSANGNTALVWSNLNTTNGAMTVSDLNSDGMLDLIAGTAYCSYPLDGGPRQPGRIKAWRLPVSAATARIEWGKAQHNLRNTSGVPLYYPIPGETTPPAVAIVTLSGETTVMGTTVTGTIPVNVNAVDNGSVIGVRLYVDGSLVASDLTSPFNLMWNTQLHSNGMHTLVVKAYDAAGNFGASPPVTVNVKDLTGPTLSYSGEAGVWAANKPVFTANASDPSGVAKVEFRLEGRLIATDTTAPYSVQPALNKYKGRTVTLLLKAYDTLGNSSTVSATCTVY